MALLVSLTDQILLCRRQGKGALVKAGDVLLVRRFEVLYIIRHFEI